MKYEKNQPPTFKKTFPCTILSPPFLKFLRFPPSEGGNQKKGGPNYDAPNNFETFFDVCVCTKTLWEFIIPEGSLAKAKVTLGIF